MKIVGDTTVTLPYSLDFCAKGPDVDPLMLSVNGVDLTLFFPPSMSEGTVGQSFFPSGWAWWTGTTLRLTASTLAPEGEIDVEAVRVVLLTTANDVLRRFLTAYRSTFSKPHIYPILIESKDFSLGLLYENGTIDALPEPEDAFFYRRIPADAPLSTSVNSTTLGTLLGALESDLEISPTEQLSLDADWYELRGEADKAKLLRSFL